MRLLTRLLPVIAFCALAFAGCNSPIPPTSTPVPPATPALNPLPPGVLLVYQKSGCFAGIHDTLTLHTDGTLEWTDRQGNKQQGKATSQDLSAVQQVLAAPEFRRLEPVYQAAGADLCVYEITARLGDGSTGTVETMDAAPTPDFLARFIKQLDSLRSHVS